MLETGHDPACFTLDSTVSDALTVSFCERCGSRHEFRAPTTVNALRKTRGLIGGLRNYLVGHEGLTESVRGAIQLEESAVTAAQLEAFHNAVHLCLGCRQYTCNDCWNADAGKCRSCVPMPGVDDLADRIAASLDGSAVVPVFEHPEAEPLPAESWPTADHEVFPERPSVAASAVAELQPEPAEEPEPVVADAPPPEPMPLMVVEEPAEEAEMAAMAEVASPLAVGQSTTETEDETEVETEAEEPIPVADVPRLRVVAWDEDAPLPEPEPEPIAALEPVPELEPGAELEPVADLGPVVELEPVAELEPVPEPAVAEAPAAAEDLDEAPVAEEFEPTPVAATLSEPEVAATEPELESEILPVAAVPESLEEQPPAPETPQPIRPHRSGPMREKLVRLQPPAAPPAPTPHLRVAAAADTGEVAARRAQLEELGLGDATEAPVAEVEPRILPYRSRGARVSNRDAVVAAISDGALLWEASAREVGAAGVTVQSCTSCGLALAASARFCRRCGTRQAQSA